MNVFMTIVIVNAVLVPQEELEPCRLSSGDSGLLPRFPQQILDQQIQTDHLPGSMPYTDPLHQRTTHHAELRRYATAPEHRYFPFPEDWWITKVWLQ